MSSVYEELAVVGVTESGNDGHVGTNVIDNSLENQSRWSCEGFGSWIQLELEQLSDITFLEIAFYKGDKRVNTFDILTSQNGVDFEIAATGFKNSGTSAGFEAYLLPEVKRAKFVKIVVTDVTGTQWCSILEINVQGNKVILPLFQWTVSSSLDGQNYEKVLEIKANDVKAEKGELVDGPDVIPPQITAPADIVMHVDPAELPIAIDIGSATVTDNRDSSELEVTSDEPETFGKGVTVVTWTVKDAAGNVATAEQTISINTIIKLEKIIFSSSTVEAFDNEEIIFEAIAENNDGTPRVGQVMDIISVNLATLATEKLGVVTTDANGKAVLSHVFSAGRYTIHAEGETAQ